MERKIMVKSYSKYWQFSLFQYQCQLQQLLVVGTQWRQCSLTQFLWTMLFYVPTLQFRDKSMECSCNINWVLIYLYPLLPIFYSLEPPFPLPLPKSCMLSEALPPMLPEPELQVHAPDAADSSTPDCFRSQDDTELKKVSSFEILGISDICWWMLPIKC